MHLIVRDGASLDEIGEPQDLQLAPADFILLSFSDSDLAMFRAGLSSLLMVRDGLRPPHHEGVPQPHWEPRAAIAQPHPEEPHCGVSMKDGQPISAHFINLSSLRHPISTDLFIEKTVPGTRAIVLRLLGGLDYWRYGAEELAHACRKQGVALALLPGDGRADPRLPPLATLMPGELEALDRLTGAGGPQNAARVMSAMLGRAGGAPIEISRSPVEALPDFGIYRRAGQTGGGSVAIVFYRSFLLADDVRPIDSLMAALEHYPSSCPSPIGRRDVAAFAVPRNESSREKRRPLSHWEREGVRGDTPGLSVIAYYVPSLKAPDAADWLREQLKLTRRTSSSTRRRSPRAERPAARRSTAPAAP